MSKTYEVSIIIVTWNTAKITLACIRSINKFLKNKLDYEIILVDNASSDNTLDLLKKEPNLSIIKNKENLGFSKANNIGAKKAKSNILFFLNSDMELTDSNLPLLIDFLKSNPQIAALGPKFLNPDLTPQASVFNPQTPLNAFKEYFLGIKDAFSKYYPQKLSPQNVDIISGGALLIKREVFNKIGGWDERYFFYYEDLELCRQIKKLGYDIFYYPKMKVIHRHGASGTKITDESNQWKRLIPSSKIYHGTLKHYLITSILWLSQKLKLN